MKLLLDQGLPRSAAELLRSDGTDAVHVGEIGMSQAADASILQEARATSRVVVTLDADFHALLALSGASSPSVIRIRVEGMRAEQHAALIRRICVDCGVALEDGAVVSTDGHVARVRRLPLGTTNLR